MAIFGSNELKRVYGDPMDKIQGWLSSHSPEENKVFKKYGYKPKRNAICPCGSRKKYKNCCYDIDKQL